MTGKEWSKNEDILRPIFIEGLLRIRDWLCTENTPYLWSIFDQVGFRDRDENTARYYAVPTSLSPRIVYPVREEADVLKTEKGKILSELNEHHKGFSKNYLDSLAINQLFFLLEKFGGNTPSDDAGLTSVFDTYKIRAAKRIIEENREFSDHADNLFINIDISGIQRFIYNISSSGALKNLRSRSFFIELLCNHIIYRVLTAFNLHYANVFMNGGGNIYVLSTCPEDYEGRLNSISNGINKWLLQKLNGRLYAAFSQVPCTDEDLGNKLQELIGELTRKSFVEKRRKFSALIAQGEFDFVEPDDPTYQQCEICYKDDSRSPIHKIPHTENRFRCSLCNRLVELGNQIPRTSFVYECDKDTAKCIEIEGSHYLLSDDEISALCCIWVIYDDTSHFIDRLQGRAVHIFARTYTKKNRDLPKKVRDKMNESYEALTNRMKTLEASLSSEESQENRSDLKEEIQFLKEEIQTLEDDSTATLDYLAESSDGTKLIGALRMDADNIGKFLRDGFYNQITLEKLSSFSRNLNSFFKLHLESVCEEGLRKANDSPVLSVKDKGRDAHIIYAGGDDLFALGAWSDVAAMATDISEAFNKYTCGNDNLDLGISGGLTLQKSRFPVGKMADESMAALRAAKNSRQPCWMCRKDWIGCSLYEEGCCLRKDSLCLFYTDYMAAKKKSLDEEHRMPKYSQECSRLNLALKRKHYDTDASKIKDEIEEYIVKPLEAFSRGYSVLSGAFFNNALSLLDTWYEEGTLYLPRVVWMIEKFKNELKRHKTDGESSATLYDLYELYLHFFDTTRFSSLHIPLSWIVLLMKGDKNNEN